MKTQASPLNKSYSFDEYYFLFTPDDEYLLVTSKENPSESIDVYPIPIYEHDNPTEVYLTLNPETNNIDISTTQPPMLSNCQTKEDFLLSHDANLFKAIALKSYENEPSEKAILLEAAGIGIIDVMDTDPASMKYINYKITSSNISPAAGGGMQKIIGVSIARGQATATISFGNSPKTRKTNVIRFKAFYEPA